MRAIKSAAPFFRRKPRTLPAPQSTTRVKVTIGEVGIHEDNGREVILRPSLYAMSQLGDPDEIVSLFANVCSDPLTASEARLQQANVIAVLQACAPCDISRLTGYHDGTTIKPGKIEPRVMLILARRLLCHGITGTLPEPEREPGMPEPTYTRTFDARGFVATAMAHLGMSEDDAWNITMTAFVGAMRSKYPPVKDTTQPGATAPSKKEYDEAKKMLAQVNQIRRQKNV